MADHISFVVLICSNLIVNFRLGYNELKQLAVSYITDAYAIQCPLEILDMSGNSLCGSRSNNTFDPTMLIALCSRIKSASNLHTLILSNGDVRLFYSNLITIE